METVEIKFLNKVYNIDVETAKRWQQIIEKFENEKT